MDNDGKMLYDRDNQTEMAIILPRSLWQKPCHVMIYRRVQKSPMKYTVEAVIRAAIIRQKCTYSL